MIYFEDIGSTGQMKSSEINKLSNLLMPTMATVKKFSLCALLSFGTLFFKIYKNPTHKLKDQIQDLPY